jgi:hypothetical protein
MPDALPTSFSLTAPNTALCAAGMATETRRPRSCSASSLATSPPTFTRATTVDASSITGNGEPPRILRPIGPDLRLENTSSACESWHRRPGAGWHLILAGSRANANAETLRRQASSGKAWPPRSPICRRSTCIDKRAEKRSRGSGPVDNVQGPGLVACRDSSVVWRRLWRSSSLVPPISRCS